MDDVGKLIKGMVGIELSIKLGLKELYGRRRIGVGFDRLHNKSNLQYYEEKACIFEKGIADDNIEKATDNAGMNL